MPPPDIDNAWDANDSWKQAELLAYQQIRELEEEERLSLAAGAAHVSNLVR